MADSEETRIAVLRETIARLEKDLESFEKDIEAFNHKLNDYVLKLIFEAHKEQLDGRIKPLERLLYGLVGLVLMAVVTAVIATVVNSGGGG